MFITFCNISKFREKTINLVKTSHLESNKFHIRYGYHQF